MSISKHLDEFHNIIQCVTYLTITSIVIPLFHVHHRDPAVPVERTGKAISENEIVSTLPADADQKTDALFDLAIDSAKRLFSARSIQFKLPEETTETIARSLEEGRLLKKGAYRVQPCPVLTDRLPLVCFRTPTTTITFNSSPTTINSPPPNPR